MFSADSAQETFYTARIFNASDSEPIVAEFSLLPNATFAKPINDLVPEVKEFLGGKIGWLYLTTAPASFSNVHYAIVYKDRSVAADHAF